MAKILNKDPAQYACEREAFLRELQHFHDTRGTPFRRPPVIGETPIDLYLLYNLVTARGGWVKITNKNEWHTLTDYFNLPAQCVNIGVALKHTYLRYLDRYEKVHFLGEIADRASDDDDENRHKRWSARAMHSVPLSYNYHQHNIAESTRSHNGLSADLYKPSDYERLLLCLISPLPNEQDFAINTCTLLSNEGKHHLKLEKCPRLIDYLLAHAGVFNHISLRPLFHHVYSKVRKQPLTSFWYDLIVHEQFVDLTNEAKFVKRKTVLPVLNTFSKKDKTGATKSPLKSVSPKKNATDNNEMQAEPKPSGSTANDSIDIALPSCSTSETPSDNNLVSDSGRLSDTKDNENTDEPVPSSSSSSNSNNVHSKNSVDLTSAVDVSDNDLFAPSNDECYEGKQKFKLKIEPGDRELFCVGRTLGTQEYVGQRVLQIANILRNLSFTEDNITMLANNITFIRFLLLCTNSRWNTLHQYGFDMLSNVATEISLKDPIRDRLSECLLLTITQGLSCDDRFVVISSLDVLNKLSQNEANEDVLLRYLERNVYEQVCTFLTIQDIMLLIYTLECMYALTTLGERACNHISKVTGIYDILVSLITVEAQSYGPKACIGMKVVETVPPGGATIAPQSTTTVTTSISSPSSISTSVTSSSSLSTIVTPALPMTSPNVATPIFTSISTATSTSNVTPVTRLAVTNTNTVSSNIRNTPTLLSTVPTPSPPLISQPPVSLPQPVVQTPNKTQIQPINHNVQQQHAHQQAIHENEQFALAWLRANFEPDLKGRIEQQELYRNYLNSCSKIGRKGVIAPLHFPRCVRSTFGGTVGPNPCKVDNQQYYEGIKMRAQPLTINCQPMVQQQISQPAQPSSPRPATPKNTNKRNSNATKIQNTPQVIQPTMLSPTPSESTANDLMTTPPPSPASPILKAQLSAPFKKETTTVIKMEPAKSQVSAHPHLSQALLGASSGGPTVASNGGNLNQLTNMNVNVNKEPLTNNSSNLPNSVPPNSSSLIKSLLATKVTNDCMRTTSVVTTECSTASHVASVVNTQVTQRQQRIAQQNQNQNVTPQPVIQAVKTVKYTKTPESLNNCRINGAQMKTDLDSVATSTSQLITPINQTDFANTQLLNARINSQQIPPPLAPLSSGGVKHIKTSSPRLDIEDSNSIGNISIASNSGLGNTPMSVTEDGDNSLTSFEGLLLNGVPPTSLDIDAPCNEDNSSNMSIKPKTQSLMLADLLEKKIEKKDPPLMNGVLRIGDKGLELVENHIEKVLMTKESSIINKLADKESKGVSVIVDSNELNRTVVLASTQPPNTTQICNNEPTAQAVESVNTAQSPLKRPATDEPEDVQIKRPHLSSVIVSNTSVNGNVTNAVECMNTDTVDSSNGDEGEVGSVSSTAANLYAALAADVLDEEDMDEDIPQPTLPPPVSPAPVQQAPPIPQPQPQFAQIMQNKIITSPPPTPQPPTQQLIVHTGNRQIIVSQPQVMNAGGPPQMIFTAGGQIIQQGAAGTATIKTPQGHQMPVLVQTNQTLQNNQQRMVFSHMPQSVQFVGAQGNQYVISSNNASGQTTYVMAQPQTAIVQGQTQTVLVAQTTQQGTPAKTIIILQPQNSATHPQQKVVMTPQGQQMVMTQVARPMIQTSTIVSSAPMLPTANQQTTVITTNVSTSNIVKTIASVSSGQSTTCTPVVSKPVVGGSTTPFIQQCPVSKVITCTKTTPNTSVVTVPSTTDTKPTQPTVVRTCGGKQTVKPVGNQSVTTHVDSVYVCEWKGCSNKSGYKSANEVLLHAVDAHCPTGTEEIVCMWERCDSMKRKRFSLMTHLIDRHCNPEAMKLNAVRRKQSTGRNETPTVTAPHPGYAPDAALHAIKRHALEFVNPKELMQQRMDKQHQSTVTNTSTSIIVSSGLTEQAIQECWRDDNEGPVTKSIRLTASLILRNLVIYSNNSRRFLRHFEPHLANVAMSNVESSRTIAQILFDLNDYNSGRR